MAVAVREKPILFNGEMVRAILEGRKVQTRRVVKPQPEFGVHACSYTDTGWAHRASHGACTCERIAGPQVGDRLWVRETWAQTVGDKGSALVYYPADESCRAIIAECDGEGDPCGTEPTHERPFMEVLKKPSIHMPRWASRITLEVTEVRVERLWEISRQDVLAEGIGQEHLAKNDKFFHRGDVPGITFAEFWDRTNTSHPWASNPWVFVISFKRIES